MKNKRRNFVLFLAAVLLSNPVAYAEATLPADNDRDAWRNLLDTFAECSAVYNLVATLQAIPEKGTTTSYRELANNALISGMMSAEKSGFHEDYLESIYSVKLGLWERAAKDKSQQPVLLERANNCIITALPYQNLIIGTLRNQSAKQ